ncbi:MAG: hypothetical protein HWE23_03115 [Rhodobacteraceae bacterium]|nr:hypothetical protein [Paracoccaceae bacterium]
MKGRYFKAALILSAAVVGTYFLFPDPNAEISILIKDGRHDEAYQLAQKSVERSPKDTILRMELAKLQRYRGELDAYEGSLKAILGEEPENVIVQNMLLDHYFTMNNEDTYFQNLEQVALHTKDPAHLSHLVAFRRLDGNHEQELRWLKLLVEASAASLTELDTSRLVLLLLKDGEREEALAYFRTLDNPADAGVDIWGMRAQVFNVLMKTGEPSEAGERAKAWIAQSTDVAGLKGALGIMMSDCWEMGRGDIAVNLAGKAVYRYPELGLAASRFAYKLGLSADAERYLEFMLEKNYAFSSEELGEFVSLKAQFQGPMIAAEFLLAYGPEKVSGEQVVSLIEMLLQAHQDDLAEQLSRYVPADERRFFPLVATKLAMLEGNMVEARQLLEPVKLETLEFSDAEQWFELALGLFGPTYVRQRFLDVPQLGHLNRELLTTYAGFLKASDDEELQRVLIALGGRFPVKGTINGPNMISVR